MALSAAGPMPSSLRLTYFNIQGAGEKVRLAFVLGGISFEDVRVPFPDWAALKPTTPYGQLPLLSIDGGTPMAQSGAMLRYAGALATNNGVPLYPVEQMLEIEEALGLVGDLQRDWRPPVGIALDCTTYGYAADFKGTPEHQAVIKSMRENFVQASLPRYMGFLEKRFTGSGGFLVGPTPTIADCALVPVLNRFTSGGVDHVPVDCLEPFPVVREYVTRFMELPAVKTWCEWCIAAPGFFPLQG